MLNLYPPYGPDISDSAAARLAAKELSSMGHTVRTLHSLDAYKYKARTWLMNPAARLRIASDNTIITSRLGRWNAVLSYTTGWSHSAERTLNQVVTEYRPDVIHFHNISLLGYRVLRKLGRQLYVMTAHDYWPICPRGDLMKFGRSTCVEKACLSCTVLNDFKVQPFRYNPHFSRTIRDLDLIIAPSKFMQDRLRKELDNRIVHIPNFADYPPACISPTGKRDFFLYAGSLTELKGLKVLLKTYQQFKEIQRELIVVGSGPLAQFITKYVSHYGLEERVHFLGRVSKLQLWRLLSDAAALIIPSIWPENAPVIALESLAVGTPVIGSDAGGLPEIVSLLDPNLIHVHGSPQSLARALLNFKSKYEKDSVKAIFRQNFSAKQYVRRYINIIEALV